MPIGGLTLSYVMHKIIKTTIFEHERARQRIVCFLPYCMVLLTYICLMSAILKNHNYGGHEQSSIFLTQLFGIDTVIIAAVGYPVVMLPACRFYILRKARGMTQQRMTPKMSMLKASKL